MFSWNYYLCGGQNDQEHGEPEESLCYYIFNSVFNRITVTSLEINRAWAYGYVVS